MPKKKQTIPAYLLKNPLTPELACRAVAEKGGFGPVEQEWGCELLQVLDNARDGHREIDVVAAVAVALIAYGGMAEAISCDCPRCRKQASNPKFLSERVDALAVAIAACCGSPGDMMLALGTALGLVMKAMRNAAP